LDLVFTLKSKSMNVDQEKVCNKNWENLCVNLSMLVGPFNQTVAEEECCNF
jgi:hypothetical protein